LSGLILGIEYEEMLERFDDIEAFADLGEFIDQPVKTYSSGMRGRLGFAVAINVEPDVLVIDEALSAGDAGFKKKAIQRMYDLRESGSTVLFVSHSMGMVQRFCTEAMLLHRGKLLTKGDPEEVVERYEEIIAKSQEMQDVEAGELDEVLDYELEHEEEEVTPTRGEAPAAGMISDASSVAGKAGILGLELLDENGQATGELASGERLTVRTRLRYEEAVEDSILGITLHSESAGLAVFSTDTAIEGTGLGRKEADEQATVDFSFAVPLEPGAYNVRASLTIPQGENQDVTHAQDTATFEITQEGAPGPVRGLVRLPANVEVHGLEARQEGPGRPA
jgi:ABC-2 type transport system ATP-binding protein